MKHRFFAVLAVALSLSACNTDNSTETTSTDTIEQGLMAAPQLWSPKNGIIYNNSAPSWCWGSGPCTNMTADVGCDKANAVACAVLVDGAVVSGTIWDPDPTLTMEFFFTPNTPYAEGRHTMAVRETDAYNNVMQTPDYPFCVDIISPTVPVVLSPTSNATVSSNAFTVSGTAEAGTVIYLSDDTYMLIGGPIPVANDGTWAGTATGAQVGANTLHVSAVTDCGFQEGRWSETEAQVSITVQ